jgi:hypothetical protein
MLRGPQRQSIPARGHAGNAVSVGILLHLDFPY